jgi:hypothetical protein
MMLPEEISFVVTSDPSAGATNRSADGSYFEVQLDDGLQIPKDALNVNVRVEEASIWWVVPNIIKGQNDKMYITGEDAPVTTSYDTMGFDVNNTFSISSVIIDILTTGYPKKAVHTIFIKGSSNLIFFKETTCIKLIELENYNFES